jgi:predicted nuclease with TOPRIM domain
MNTSLTPNADKAVGCFDEPIKIDSINKLTLKKKDPLVAALQKINKDSKKIQERVEKLERLDESLEEEILQNLVETVQNLNICYGDLLTSFYPTKHFVTDTDELEVFEEYKKSLEDIEKDYAVQDTSVLTRFFSKCSQVVKRALR